MKQFRTVLFWLHLACGAAAGLVILIMSGTGAVLALKPQIQEWVDRDLRSVTPVATGRLGPQQLLTSVVAARPGAAPQSLAMTRDADTAATVNLGRDGNVYVDPYSGAVLGTGSTRTAEFFQTLTNWHRYLGATGENRATGRSFTGASNLAFLVLGITGLYIWLPKRFTLQYLKPILWFRRTSTGRARDFNWHNTIGFWCLIPIVIMTVSGAVLSYSWASDLVYRLAGSPVPAARGDGPGGRGQGPGGEQREGRGRGGRGLDARDGGARPGGGREGGGRPEGGRGPGGDAPAVAIIPEQLDQIWARAEQQMPTWSLLSMRLPNREGGTVAFTITDGANWNSFARSNLTLSGSGEVVQWQPYEASSPGQKLRGWLRFAHTGELAGLAGQVVAGLGCLGGVFLVYTGLSLAFRRLWNWSLWKRFASGRNTGDLPSAGQVPARTPDALTE